MPRETEIKLKIMDTQELLRRLKKLGARPIGSGSACVHQDNVIFDTPQGGLAKHGQLLRIRTETPQANHHKKPGETGRRFLLTFKRPVAKASGANPEAIPGTRHKVREELELAIGDAPTLSAIFEGLGMSGWFRNEKYRTTYTLPGSQKWAKGLLIELDETPIGTFVELEGPAEAIDRAAANLGFSKRDFILKNYLVLYVEDCKKRGEEPRHMIFSDSKNHSKSPSRKK